MTFEIPKTLPDLNSLLTNEVINVELNDIDVDRMMTHILEMVVKKGRRASSRTKAGEYEAYLDKLQTSPHLTGVNGGREREFLDGWIRTSVVKQERASQRRDKVQMGYIRPLTIAAYRSGLPTTPSRNRRADSLTYRCMENVLRARGVTDPSAEIKRLWTATFGQGVYLGEAPWKEPTYDGVTDVDIDTLVALRFLEGFPGSDHLSKERAPLDPPVPEAVEPLGRDLISLLTHFGPKLPVTESYSHVSAVLTLRLFQLPLITGRRVRALLSGESDQIVGNPSEMYCDFVQRRGSHSDELSRVCVVRDLDILRTFFGDRLLVRSLDQSVHLLSGNPDLGTTAAERLTALANLRADPEMQMALRLIMTQIESQLDPDDDGRVFIAELREAGIDAPDQLAAILVEGLRRRGLENQVKWFWSSGGIDKAYGLLSGSKMARASWRYSPGDESLITLLCLCFVEPEGNGTSRRLPIKTVLDRLEGRFGILIDRPPRDLDSADARSGAAENLAAFTRRLQLLGCFQGLSDDFNAQFVSCPRGVNHD